MSNKKLLFASLLIVCIHCSCTKIYLRMMGVKDPHTVNKETLVNYLDKQNIHTDLVLEVDSVRYARLISQKQKDSTVYKNPDWWVKNHIQPTQVIFINKKTDKSIAAYFNCISESRGITNLTYNKYNELEFFPPLTYTDPRWIDSLFSTTEILSSFNNLNGVPFNYSDDGKPYLTLVFYSLMIEKQSTNIIRETRTYINTCLKDSCQVLYVNMDNYLFSQMK